MIDNLIDGYCELIDQGLAVFSGWGAMRAQHAFSFLKQFVPYGFRIEPGVRSPFSAPTSLGLARISHQGVERGRAMCDKWRAINQLPHDRSAAS